MKVGGAMIETNIRIVGYGEQLHLDVRRVQMHMSDTAPDLPEKVCRSLRFRDGLAAVSHLSNGVPQLFVLSRCPLSESVLEGDDWRVELADVGQTRLYVNEPRNAGLVARLIERHLLVQLGQHTDLWTLDSPRIWYEAEPFMVKDGIAATRRFHISVMPIKDEGLGVVTYVSTAFFTVDTVADFFDESLPPDVREQRQWRFEELSMRRRGQKGTLLYDLRRSCHKCYFEEFLPGVTCATTDTPPVHGTTYSSLHNYYECRHPYAGITTADPVARVSFPRLDRPLPVAANRLRLRVMNRDVPDSLKQVDKIPPQERIQLIDRFWETVGEDLLGKGLKPGLWRPLSTKIACLELPTLLFGQGVELPPPAENTVDAYRTHFRSRLTTLNRAGCYYVRPTVERQIVVTYPNHLERAMVDEFSDGLVDRLERWTGKRLSAERLPVASIPEAVGKLNSRGMGMVVFIFDKREPETYYLLSAELRNWRIKRVTTGELTRRFREHSFADMNALDVLEQLECVPWTLATPLNYHAQLAIDVGVDRRYFALSLLVCRSQSHQTPFWLDSLICPKPDDRETIERILLRDQIVKLCGRLLPRRPDPIETLLVLRDGRESGEEGDAIGEAQTELVRMGILSSDPRVDIVDFAKRSLKDIRLWEHSAHGVTNAREGTALLLDSRTVILANTGAATMHQGTANPLVLSATHDGVDMKAVASDVFATAQLNWSSPRVAQRLPVPIRRTDQILEERRAQEIRGLR